jgi:hypothetical protein
LNLEKSLSVAATTSAPLANPKMQMDYGWVGGGGSSYEQIPDGAENWGGDQRPTIDVT